MGTVTIVDKRFVIEGVTGRTPIAEAAPRLLLAKARPLFELEARARSGADADAVHDMRVASRRLREAMRLLEPLYPRKRFRVWYRSVQAITRALGPVRDADVFIEAFSRMEPELGSEGRRAATFFASYRMGQREGELRTLNDRLTALDLKASRREFKSLVRDLANTEWPDRPFTEFAHAEVAARAAVVFGAQPAALDEENIEQQHALRIDYKRLRYAVEAFAPCYQTRFSNVHSVLVGFQDVLGELHDVHVFLDAVRAPGCAEAALVVGVREEGIKEIEAFLESRASGEFAAFRQLAEEHSPESLLPALLLPLAGSSEAIVSGDPPEIIVEEAELAVEACAVIDADGSIASPVVVGEEPWAVGWEDPEVR